MDPEVSERFERVEANLEKLVGIVSSLTGVAKSHEERLHRLTETQAKTDEQLGILIRMMDEWIRRNPGNGKGPAADG
ncbi:MAG: hypothetical protein HY236_10985 [Acidobacteria bacterium]|nr:hypothetical protein [Acidobacteriota bacterium]